MFKLLFILSAFLVVHILSLDPSKSPVRVRENSNSNRKKSNRTVLDVDLDEHESVETISDNAIVVLMEKMNDRLTAMSTINEQQLRRLESLEYRITKLEVQIQEKTDSLRTDLKEVSRRTQQIDWQSSKTESTLDTLKSDTTFLKQTMEHFRLLNSNSGSSSTIDVQVSNKLQNIVRGTQTILNSLSNIQYDMALFNRNLTKISNSSSILDTILPQLMTTKHFQLSLLDLNRCTSHQLTCNMPATNSIALDNNIIARDCSEVTGNISGIYRIQPPKALAPFFVYCEFETKLGNANENGPWTVIQRREEGSLDYYKGWHDYKHGFGNIGGEYWLGLEKIHLLTDFRVNELYIELEDFALEKAFAHYSAFAVGSEIEGYPISFLGSYDGTAGDSLLYHAGQKFSTFDVDHDNWPEGNCAQSHTGAWWYNGCDTSNLNGRYLNGELPDQYEYGGMYWYEWHGPKYSLKATKIMVRPFHQTEH